MPIDLYQSDPSGPCRSVRLVAAAIGVELNLVETNLLVEEHLTPKFLKMNPQHAIPTLDDNGFYLAESRAICTYLIDRYAKDDSLYPKDLKQRAVVDQRLYFDMETMYHAFVHYYLTQIYRKQPADPAKFEKINQAFQLLDKFLEEQDYVAGNHLTVADIVLIQSVSNYTMFNYDMSKYKNVTRWFAKVKSELPRYKEINEKGLKAYKEILDHFQATGKTFNYP